VGAGTVDALDRLIDEPDVVHRPHVDPEPQSIPDQRVLEPDQRVAGGKIDFESRTPDNPFVTSSIRDLRIAIMMQIDHQRVGTCRYELLSGEVAARPGPAPTPRKPLRLRRQGIVARHQRYQGDRERDQPGAYQPHSMSCSIQGALKSSMTRREGKRSSTVPRHRGDCDMTLGAL